MTKADRRTTVVYLATNKDGSMFYGHTSVDIPFTEINPAFYIRLVEFVEGLVRAANKDIVLLHIVPLQIVQSILTDSE